MNKKAILTISFLFAAACGAASFFAIASAGDRTVVTTTSCSGNYCVETQTVYEETWANGFVIISTTSRTYQRSNSER